MSEMTNAELAQLLLSWAGLSLTPAELKEQLTLAATRLSAPAGMEAEKVAREVRDILDRYNHGPHETERWYATVEAIERKVKALRSSALPAGQWKPVRCLVCDVLIGQNAPRSYCCLSCAARVVAATGDEMAPPASDARGEGEKR